MVTRDRLRTLSFLFSSYVFRFCRRFSFSASSFRSSPLWFLRVPFFVTRSLVNGFDACHETINAVSSELGLKIRCRNSNVSRFTQSSLLFAPCCVFSIPVHLLYVDRFERFVVKSRRGISSLYPVSRFKVHFQIDRHLLCLACNDASD